MSSQQAKGEDLQGGGGGEEPDTPPELREVQGRILGLCAGVLGDENASAGEVSAATACLSLVGGPAKARRHLLSRRSRTLATAAADFRGASPRDVVPSAGAYLSCFLAECSGCRCHWLGGAEEGGRDVPGTLPRTYSRTRRRRPR